MRNLTIKRAQHLKKNVPRDAYDGINWRGERGGKNAKLIPGWSLTPSSGWTKAAHIAGFNSAPWWHGSAPTPSRAFPLPIVELMNDEYID